MPWSGLVDRYISTIIWEKTAHKENEFELKGPTYLYIKSFITNPSSLELNRAWTNAPVVASESPRSVSRNGVGHRVAIVDGHSVRHAAARVQHEAGGAAADQKWEHGLDRHVHGRGVKLFEHDLERRHNNSR